MKKDPEPPREPGDGEELRPPRASDIGFPVLTSRRWQVLRIIHFREEVDAKEAASTMGISIQAVSNHLSALYSQGLIVPNAAAGLTRPRKWLLTEIGERYIALGIESRMHHSRGK